MAGWVGGADFYVDGKSEVMIWLDPRDVSYVTTAFLGSVLLPSISVVQNYDEISPHTCQDDYYQKDKK